MEKVLKVGVVGCGEIAQIAHIPYLKELPNFQVEAICDVSPQVLQAVGDHYGITRRYTDYRELVALRDLDVVLVSNRDHCDPAVAAMDAGKHVMVEKPMAFNLEQVDQMIAAAERNRVKLMVAYMKRFDPGYQWALGLIKQMEGVHLIRVHDFGGSYDINQWIYDLARPKDVPAKLVAEAREKENAALIQAIGQQRAHLVDTFSLLMYNCSHDAIVLHEAFGQQAKIVHAEIYDRDFVLAVLDYGPKTRCIWETGLELNLTDWDEQLSVYDRERRVTVKFPFPYLRNAATEVWVGEMDGKAFVEKRVVASFDEAFKREWRHFYECVVEDREPITNGQKARADISLLIDLVKTAVP